MRQHVLIRILTVAGALFMGGASLNAAPTNAPPTELPKSGKPQKKYVLSPNDVVDIKVYRQPDLETKARVTADGTITMPLLGVITINGKTAEEARIMISELLAKDYLVDPQVSLTIVDYAKRYFTVLGEVLRPGQMEMPPEQSINLLQAIAMAGGFTRLGAPSKVKVQRTEDGQKRVYDLDSSSMAKDEKVDLFTIQPGDTISVGERVF